MCGVDETHRVSLSGFFYVMSGDDDGLVSILCDLNQMGPNALTKQRIHSDCWLVENEKFRIVHQSNSERYSSLLSTTGKNKCVCKKKEFEGREGKVRTEWSPRT